MPDNLNALFDAGCDDATFGQRDSLYYADFDRQAPSFAEAVGSAIRNVEAAVPGLHVVRVEPEELVSASEIAARTGRSRESVRLLIQARRGPGGFPPPVAWIGGRRPLWRWTDVANWFFSCLRDERAATEQASFIAALNGALEVRSRIAYLAAESERAEVARVIAQDAELLAV
ncbi:MAG: helix-turn-helix transcriptional regulator [Chloroflexota bacterium]